MYIIYLESKAWLARLPVFVPYGIEKAVQTFRRVSKLLNHKSRSVVKKKRGRFDASHTFRQNSDSVTVFHYLIPSMV